jgi:hypothetical protein
VSGVTLHEKWKGKSGMGWIEGIVDLIAGKGSRQSPLMGHFDWPIVQ